MVAAVVWVLCAAAGDGEEGDAARDLRLLEGPRGGRRPAPVRPRAHASREYTNTRQRRTHASGEYTPAAHTRQRRIHGPGQLRLGLEARTPCG